MKTELIAVVSAVVIVVIALGIIKYQEVKIDRLTAEATRLKIELAQTDKELAVANDKIAKQNEAIAAMAVDSEATKVVYEQKIAATQAEYTRQKLIIKTELARDPSCENELRLVSEQLRVFMGEI